jgi:hypothetical protein
MRRGVFVKTWLLAFALCGIFVGAVCLSASEDSAGAETKGHGKPIIASSSAPKVPVKVEKVLLNSKHEVNKISY